MDKLPPELKQRICSFVRNKPRTLERIRLVSKDFASAAAPYLIPRVFLFKHKDSCEEVREIVEHSVFSKHITTLVVDPNNLKNHKSFQEWVDEHEHLVNEYPVWEKFKPRDIEYDGLYEGDGHPRLETSLARAKWSDAFKNFEQAVEKVNKSIKRDREYSWEAQCEIATYQSTEEFRRVFLDTIALAFRMCPNLVNIIIAPPSRGSDHVRDRMFSLFRDIYPHDGAWVDLASYDPAGFELADLLSATNQQKAGLNTLTIIDVPFRATDYSRIKSLRSFETLKHIRIYYAENEEDPKTGFAFNLEKAIHKASSLETLWIDMPPNADAFEGGAMLQGINSKTLRDVMIRAFAVSEDVLVSFLLRHAHSLQQLDLHATLTVGTWKSVLQRISGQMTALTKLQISSLREFRESKLAMLFNKWSGEVRDSLLEGAVLPEPYDMDIREDGFGHSGYTATNHRRYDDLPEIGLWRDYDRILSNSTYC